MSGTDVVLLQRWIDRRDASAFNELVSRHADLVFSVSKRLLKNEADAEDLAQDCFVKLATVSSTPPSSLAAWLHTVATRAAIDVLRSSRFRRERERRFARDRKRQRTSRRALEELESHVDDCVAALPGELREVIVAHFLERCAQRDIAERLGVSRQTVTHRVSKGVAKVRELLRQRGVIAPTATLTAFLSGLSLEAAPPGLVTSLGRVALAGSAATAISTSSVLLGGSLMANKIVTSTTLAVLLLVLGAGGLKFVLNDGATVSSAPEPPAEGRERDADPELAVESPPQAPRGVNTAPTPPLEYTGMVIDARGTPVPDASVVIRSEAFRDAASLKARSDAEGIFRFTVPEGSTLTGFKTARVHLFAYRSGVGVGFGHRQMNTPVDLEITLDPPAQVSGRVFDAATGDGVEGLTLALTQLGRVQGEAQKLHDEAAGLFAGLERSDRTVVTNEAGNFAFPGLLPARLLYGTAPARSEPSGYRLVFTADESEYLLPGSPGGGPAIELSVAPGESVPDVEIALERGGAITGTVYGVDGLPLSSARVVLLTSFSAGRDLARASGDDGRYQFIGLAADESYAVRGSYPGLAAAESRLVRMAIHELIEGVDVHLGTGRRMQGRLVEDSGAPIAARPVALRKRVISRDVELDRTETDEAGSFVFEHLAAGNYSLWYPLGDHEIKTAPHFLMPADRDLLGLEFVLIRKGQSVGSISGRVVDSFGRPLPGLPVQAVWKSVRGRAQSADDGSFQIDGLPLGESYTVTLGPGDYWSEGIERVVSPSAGLVVVAARHGALEGVVVDATNEEPVQDYRIRVVWPRPTGPSFHGAFHRGHRESADWRWTTVRNPEGRFSLPRVKSGERHVEVRAAGYTPLRTSRLTISAEVSPELRLSLEPGEGSVASGRVIGADTGMPLPGVLVRAHQLPHFYETILNERKDNRREPGIWQLTMTDDDGRFEFGDFVPDDRFHLAAWKEGYGVATRSHVEARRAKELVLEMGAAAEIRVSCTFTADEKKYFFYAHHRKERPWDIAFTIYRRLERPGVVTLPSLPAGPYRLAMYVRKEQPYGPMSLLGDVLLELEAGETRELSLDLADFASRFGSIRGVVRGVAAPERTYLMIVSAKDGEEHYTHRQVQCSPGGEFELTGLRSGAYVLRAVNHTSYPPTTVEHRVQLADRAHATTEILFE